MEKIGSEEHNQDIFDRLRNKGYIYEDVISEFTANNRYYEFFEKKLLNQRNDVPDGMERFEYTMKVTDKDRGKNKFIITRIIKRFIRHGFRQRAENYIINSLFMLNVYFGRKDIFFNPNKNLSHSRPYVYLYEKAPKKHLRKVKSNLIVTKFMLNERKRISHCSRLVHAAICRKRQLHRCDLKTAIFLELHKIAIHPENPLTFKNSVGLSLKRLKFRVHKYTNSDIRRSSKR